MIELQGIHKSFGTLEVLKGIDLHIEKKEVVSIVGPSGAGKTTLLQVRLFREDAGKTLRVTKYETEGYISGLNRIFYGDSLGIYKFFENFSGH